MSTTSRYEQRLRLFEQSMQASMDARILRVRFEDEQLRGDVITVDGREMINFGTASYLGLNLDPRLKAGAIDAVSRYGPVYSSSTAFTAVPLYTELEDRLDRMFGGHVVISPTTTLAHLGALPLLVPRGSDIFIDVQAHASLRMAAQVLRAAGSTVRSVPHSDVGRLAEVVETSTTEHVWYLADGLYSMFGDPAPAHELALLLDRFPRLHLYFDDAHGFGWTGRHGRGSVLGQVPIRDRMIVAGSLSKSMGAGGGGVVFSDESWARRVRTLGGTMTFAGPLHPPELGAAIASADIHLSDEHEELQARLRRQIDFTRQLVVDAGLPVIAMSDTPIWYVRIGEVSDTIQVALRLQEDGFILNPSAFPAVPHGYAGVRFSNSLYLGESAIEAMVSSLVRHIAEVVQEPLVEIDLTEERSIRS